MIFLKCSKSTWKDLSQTVPKDALPYLIKLRKVIEELLGMY